MQWSELDDLGAPLIASFYGSTIEEYKVVAEFLAEKKPALLEADVSCPNTQKAGRLFDADPEVAAELTSEIKSVIGKIPLVIKLGPRLTDIGATAKTCEEAGADAICAINTMPGMVIDIDAKRPVLHNKSGGVSGSALKPIAVNCVYQIYESVKIPIIGTGGITTGEDAIEMLQAGATVLGIGTAIFYRGINVFEKICNEMQVWMKENDFASVKELRGIAHENS